MPHSSSEHPQSKGSKDQKSLQVHIASTSTRCECECGIEVDNLW